MKIRLKKGLRCDKIYLYLFFDPKGPNFLTEKGWEDA